MTQGNTSQVDFPRLGDDSSRKGITWEGSRAFINILEPSRIEMRPEDWTALLVVFNEIALQNFNLLVKDPFTVLVQKVDDGNYVASWQEANVFASGDTLAESIENLKDTINHLFWRLSSLRNSQMGRDAQDQKVTLLKHIASA